MAFEMAHKVGYIAVDTHIVMLSNEKIPKPTLADIEAETRQTYAGPLQLGEDQMAFEIGDAVTVQPFRR
jgi:ribonuclease Z